MSVTAAQGFAASGVAAGIRRSAPDVALVRSQVPAVGGAVWTTNRVLAAPVHLAKARAAARDSVRLYERVLARSPANVDAETGLIYALAQLSAAQTEPAAYWESSRAADSSTA